MPRVEGKLVSCYAIVDGERHDLMATIGPTVPGGPYGASQRVALEGSADAPWDKIESGVVTFTVPLLPGSSFPRIAQFRFPQSRRARIRKKWRMNWDNWRLEG